MKFYIINICLVVNVLVLTACNGSKQDEELAKMQQSVREYFFLPDSAQVDVEIKDTIFVEEVDEMMSTNEQNLKLIGMDMDSLSSMIDSVSYRKLALNKALDNAGLFIKNKVSDSLRAAEMTLLKYQLMQQKLIVKHMEMKQTNRLLLHLKRGVWANVAGYNIEALYKGKTENIQADFVMDTEFNILD